MSAKEGNNNKFFLAKIIPIILLIVFLALPALAQGGLRDRGTRLMGWQYPLVGQESRMKEYYLSVGDVVEITVWKHPDLTLKTIINPDGYLFYPLAGKIKAADLTVEELQAELKDKLSVYIRYPDVTVSVVQVAGNKVVVMGEVIYPGVYTYEGVISIVEAIALAGDVTRDAKMESIIVVSHNITDHPTVKRVNLFSALRKGSKDRALLLESGDIVYVPRHFIADFTEFMRNANIWSQPFSGVSNVAQSGIYIRSLSKPLDKPH